MNKSNITRGYTLKEARILLVLIPLVGLVIAMMYGAANTQESVLESLATGLHSIFSTAIIWVGCYGIVTILWRKYPWEQHPAKHIIVEVVAITLYVLAYGTLMWFLIKQFSFFDPEALEGVSIRSNFFFTLLITYLITTLHEAAFFYRQWKYNFSKSARLEKDNIEAKYETLKSQINPHFLFNSLNSLTTIVDENNEAVDYIQNLSEFLRYVLKSRDRELVLVHDEVKVLQKYISLQKSRFRQNLIMNVNIPEKYYHFSLPPLVLQMLVENSIKHNIISKDKPLTIKVFVLADKVIVENNLQKKAEVTSTKQGLKNIVDRISFFTTKEVKIIENNSIFRVEIPLLKVEL